MLENSYWNGNGKHQGLIDDLYALIPQSGSVPNPRSTNRALEKFRKASNCYYDLFNNGLGNRADEFRRVFGIPSSHYKRYNGWFEDAMFVRVEDLMNHFIEEALKEQAINMLEVA